MKRNISPLILPPHFDSSMADKVMEPDFNTLAPLARAWKTQHDITPAKDDKFKICHLGIDWQHTFCHPGSEFFKPELFVGGLSGRGAIDDAIRSAEFTYREMRVITKKKFSMDTHRVWQIFFAEALINDKGEHPNALFCPEISITDVRTGIWRISPDFAHSLAEFGVSYAGLQAHLDHYLSELEKKGKYKLTIWPYHAMIGSIGHAVLGILVEAAFFHSIARRTLTDFEIKGGGLLSENYSVLSPEVLTGPGGQSIGQRNTDLIQALLNYDAVIMDGQAGSHCFKWTIDDLLTDIMAKDPELAKKVYLLRDCTSAVVIPGVVDFTDQMNEAFDRFAKAGMNVVESTTPIANWPGIDAKSLAA